jgi:hypothetical protein
MTRRRLAAVVLPAVLLLGCGRPGPSHYATVLDEVQIPATWEFVTTVVKAPSGGDIGCTPYATDNCPSVARYYFVPTDSALAAYGEAKELVTAEGFVLIKEHFAACDAPRTGAACGESTKRNDDFIDVDVFRPGDDAGQVVPARNGAAIVVLVAHAD